jgi:predicted esterase
VLALLALLLSLAAPSQEPNQKPETRDQRPALLPGSISDRIACAADAKQGYAVYLPSAYAANRRWPVVYFLDARGRATVPLERFRAAADELGFVLISSYNSRSDTNDDPNTPALRAMWKDAHERLAALDDRRAYLSGFSGGARASVAMAFSAPSAIAGVVGCAAGLADEDAPVKSLAFPYFGTVGERDMNYYEMRALDEKLAGAKAAYRIEVFDGGHEWPPEALAREALVFLEVRAMKDGLRPRDEALAARLYGEDLDRAKALEQAGRPDAALARLRHAERDFGGLCDVAEARSGAEQLEKAGEARRLEKEARKRDDQDRGRLHRISATLSQSLAASDPPAPAVLANQLGVPALRERAASSDESERLSAERILANLRAQTGFYLPERFLERGDLARARLVLGVAAAINPGNPVGDYNLACASARSGDVPLALKDLDRAVQKGFHDFQMIDTDPDFEKIRADPRFQKWLQDARAKS